MSPSFKATWPSTKLSCYFEAYFSLAFITGYVVQVKAKPSQEERSEYEQRKRYSEFRDREMPSMGRTWRSEQHSKKPRGRRNVPFLLKN